MKYRIKNAYIEAPERLFALDAFREASRDELACLLALALGDGRDPTGLLSGDSSAYISFWRGAGVVEAASDAATSTAASDVTEAPSATEVASAEEPKKKPLRRANRLGELSAAELAPIMEDGDFKMLADSVTQLLGRLLNSTEINILAGLRTELALSCGYILALVSLCCDEGKCSLRYVEGRAFGLCGEGIDTEEALGEYIMRRRRFASTEWKLRRLWGIGERSLTKTESACFYRWSAEWGFDVETIGLAYDITVDTTKKADVRYTDKILAGWHERGVTSLADAEALVDAERDARAAARMNAGRDAAAKPSRRRSSAPSPALSSFDTDELFESALRRSYSDKKD